MHLNNQTNPILSDFDNKYEVRKVFRLSRCFGHMPQNCLWQKVELWTFLVLKYIELPHIILKRTRNDTFYKWLSNFFSVLWAKINLFMEVSTAPQRWKLRLRDASHFRVLHWNNFQIAINIHENTYYNLVTWTNNISYKNDIWKYVVICYESAITFKQFVFWLQLSNFWIENIHLSITVHSCMCSYAFFLYSSTHTTQISVVWLDSTQVSYIFSIFFSFLNVPLL